MIYPWLGTLRLLNGLLILIRFVMLVLAVALAGNQAQDLREQSTRYCNLCKLERDVPPMANHLRSDLDQLLP